MTSLLEARARLVFLEEVGGFSYLWLSLLKEIKWYCIRITHCISPSIYPVLKIKS